MTIWQLVVKKIITTVLIILTILLISWVLDKDGSLAILRATQRIFNEEGYFKQQTSPLSFDVAQDLCREFKIPDSDIKCQKQGAYAVDFYPTIIEYYSTIPEKDRTLTNVQEKIGKYEMLVRRKFYDDTYYYWHFYAFTEDQIFPIIIVFDEDGIIVEVRARHDT